MYENIAVGILIYKHVQNTEQNGYSSDLMILVQW